MTDLPIIHAKRALELAQEYIDQLLENSPDPEICRRLSQAQVHIHEARIVLSMDELMPCSDSIASNEYSDNVVSLSDVRKG